MHSTAGDRQRTFDVKVQSDNIKAVLDPQYTNAGSGGGELMFGLGGSVAGTGGMVRRNYGHDAQRGDQAALLMLHTPSVLPSDFRDEDGTRKGRRAPVSTFQNRSDNVGMLLAEPAARAAAVAASRNASAASSPNSCSASSSSASSSSSAAVGARPRPTSSYAPSSSSSDVVGMMGHQRGEASWHEPQSLSQPAAATLFYSTGGTGAGAAPSPRPNESPALMIPGQARVLKYNRDLEGSRGIITGTRVDTPVDDRPKTAGPLHTTTARDSVGAVIRGQPTITGPQLGVQPQDARGNPLGLRSGRQGGLYGAHLHQSSIQFG